MLVFIFDDLIAFSVEQLLTKKKFTVKYYVLLDSDVSVMTGEKCQTLLSSALFSVSCSLLSLLPFVFSNKRFQMEIR